MGLVLRWKRRFGSLTLKSVGGDLFAVVLCCCFVGCDCVGLNEDQLSIGVGALHLSFSAPSLFFLPLISSLCSFFGFCVFLPFLFPFLVHLFLLLSRPRSFTDAKKRGTVLSQCVFALKMR